MQVPIAPCAAPSSPHAPPTAPLGQKLCFFYLCACACALVIQIYYVAAPADRFAARSRIEYRGPSGRPPRSTTNTTPGPAPDVEVIRIVIGRWIFVAVIDPIG